MNILAFWVFRITIIISFAISFIIMLLILYQPLTKCRVSCPESRTDMAGPASQAHRTFPYKKHILEQHYAYLLSHFLHFSSPKSFKNNNNLKKMYKKLCLTWTGWLNPGFSTAFAGVNSSPINSRHSTPLHKLVWICQIYSHRANTGVQLYINILFF